MRYIIASDGIRVHTYIFSLTSLLMTFVNLNYKVPHESDSLLILSSPHEFTSLYSTTTAYQRDWRMVTYSKHVRAEPKVLQDKTVPRTKRWARPKLVDGEDR
jgi:hypothetical protein